MREGEVFKVPLLEAGSKMIAASPAPDEVGLEGR